MWNPLVRYLAYGVAGGALALSLAGCAESGVASCTTSADCASGLACQPNGSCGVIPCSEGCLEGEVCLQLDPLGNYDPTAEGVCTAVECGGRGAPQCPEGEVCIDGACYPDDGGGACVCNTDCAAGQGCVRGSCGAPATACTSDCECAVGATCTDGVCVGGGDLCAGVICDPGETCDPTSGFCAGGCDPACTEGTTCVDGACVPDTSGGGICTPCTDNAECGGPNDACIPLGAGTVCSQSCAGGAACPSGFTCLRVDSVVGDQCVPEGGTCGGCLLTGCDAGQFCNATSQACEPLSDPCDACTSGSQCGAGARCEQIGGSRFCLTECPGGGACAGGYTCQDVRGSLLCVPEGGVCGGGGACDPACTGGQVCNGALCVDCLSDTDCDAGQVCTPGGACVTSGSPCTSISDCPVGQICDTRVNTCVECITPGDCATGEVCNAGVCEGCECPEGQRCNLLGECVAGADGDCSGDSECVGQSIDLGGTGEGATCDSTIGCYTAGTCNGSFLGGGGLPIPLPIPGDFGGTTDPFDAPCPAGTTCDFIFSTDIFGGGGNLISFACKGCDPADPSTCREGESCTTPLLPFPDSTPYCAAGGGGGGFPFPFP